MILNLLEKYKNSRIGLLTNQSAYGRWEKDLYHFQTYIKHLNVRSLFFPEHGLFAELQDQVSGTGLQYGLGNVGLINLYGDTEDSLFVQYDSVKDLDLIIIDIRDVGSRYYTFLTSGFYLIQSLENMISEGKGNWKILIIDSPNPIGSQVEGSPLGKKFESFVGVESVPHRHGLTPGQLLKYYSLIYNYKISIDIIPLGSPYSLDDDVNFWIPPSPNIPTLETCFVYPGQCLLEGTNLSEGRGTTKPFEIFGAPYLSWDNNAFWKKINSYQSDWVTLRPLRFKPVMHKYSDKICHGYQIIIKDQKNYKSLRHTLFLLRSIREEYPKEFEYLQGVYEFRSDLPAIELLVGDEFLLSYLAGEGSIQDVEEYLLQKEDDWVKKIQDLGL
jgi:uncharacterized protein YbbC (DUF1343 family)